MTVCVLGSINRDIVCRVAALPRAGETIAARETMLLPGGKGANQAIAAARMGAATRIIGAVGRDGHGEALTRYLDEAGVDVGGVVRLADTPTGAAYIALDDAGENQIIVSAGANARVDPATAAARIGPGDRVVLAQLEMPVAAIKACFAAAARAGGYRILNAAPALPEGASLFAAADMLIFNQSELGRYLDADPPRTVEDAQAARRLLTRPDQSAVVTLGAGGAVLVTAEHVTAAPGRRVAVVDTTGAGDCFCGALAALLAQDVPAGRALAMANAAAAICVGRIGAAPSMPMRAEVEAAADSAN